jgi:hypothetical protein
MAITYPKDIVKRIKQATNELREGVLRHALREGVLQRAA